MTNLRQAARGEECQVRLPGICNGNRETTVLAHFRMIGISGAGMKSPDLIGAWACSACHAAVDSNAGDGERMAFLEGVLRTQNQLIKRGLVKW